MSGGASDFFGLEVVTPLVRGGSDERLQVDKESGQSSHTIVPVHVEMLLQICRDYSGLPDPRTLTLGEIRFFYEALRPELRQHTKPKK